MPQLGKLRVVVQDTSGNGLSGVTVTVYREGSTVNGTQSGPSPLAITVHDNGKIVATDSIDRWDPPYTASLNIGTVDSTTDTVVTVNSGGPAISVQDLARLVPTGSRPSLFTDDQGAGTPITNSELTTDSNGAAEAWLAEGIVDYTISGGAASTQLVRSKHITVEAPGTFTSDRSDSATATAFIFDTRENLGTAGAKLVSVQNLAVEKFAVDKDGDVTSDSGSYHSGVADSATAVGYDLDTDNTLSTAGALLLSAKNNGAERFSVDIDGDVNFRRIEAGEGTVLVAGDFALSATFGSTATVTSVQGHDHAGSIIINSIGTGQAANPTATLTWTNGTYGLHPFVVASRDDRGGTGNDQPTIIFTTDGGALTCVFTFRGTPVAGESYGLTWVVIGAGT